jgi:UPF0755 protein
MLVNNLRMKKKELFFGGIILLSVVLVTVIVYGYQILYTPNLLLKSEKSAYLYIREGTDFQALLKQMKDEKILHEPVSFAFISQLLGYQKNIKPGRYLIKPNSTNLAVVRMLRAGIQEPVKLTFNNIRLLDEFSERVAEDMSFGKENLQNALKSPKILQKYGFDTLNVIGMFLPDTYQFYWNISAEKFIDKMHDYYKKFWNEKRIKKAKEIGFSPQQVATLASIVQAETGKEDEKPRVAGVYINRLHEKMKLQADPTLVFAVGDFTIKRVLDVHKMVNSPFNTYKYAGLPPGPINMPTATSIDAVLNYEKHDYLYFCAKEDFSGYHRFAVSYNEHLRNARLYQKALDLRGVK